MNLSSLHIPDLHLPAFEIADKVNKALKKSGILVITAPPGAGKSTVLPLTILQGLPPGSGKILMLEPRRLAARQIAVRMADTIGENISETVGYRIRFESRVSSQTRIEVLTEGILTRMLTCDPALEGIDVLIFDEFHERSIHSDLALALARQSQRILRPDLRIVIMSATIDTGEICSQLEAPHIEGKGREYPVHIIHSVQDTDERKLAEDTAHAIRQAHQKHEGDILAFLPGQGEILRCAELLEGTLKGTDICPLYGNLPWQMQQQAIQRSRQGQRKVVLSTPIAETSLTIEGVRCVIDSGFCRSLVFDHRTGLSHLKTVRISQDMATQRTGRAGRVAPGVCYRLWTPQRQVTMPLRRRAEILDADLTSLVLETACFGERDVQALPWLTPPPSGAVEEARQTLRYLGALDERGQITREGRRMVAIPCHPRISRMMMLADGPAQKALASDIAAILEEKDPLPLEQAGVDITLRVEALRRERTSGRLRGMARIARIAREYHGIVGVREDNGIVLPRDVGFLLASAFPERVARAIPQMGVYRLSGGDDVIMDREDEVSAHEFIAIASLYAPPGSPGRVLLAAPAEKEDLLKLSTRRNHVYWNREQGCVLSASEDRIGKMVLRSVPMSTVSKEDIINTVSEAVKVDGLSLLSWSDAVVSLQRRVAQVRKWHPELDLPDLTTEHLLNGAKEWLPPFLTDGDKVISSTSALRKLDLCAILWSLVPYELQKEVDRLAPAFIQVPSGSRVRIDYRQGAEVPVLSVRLQECFGMEDTPKVDGGRVSLLMELLSPGFKPVQLTRDLRSFWKDTYFEVRKELKRRYPKHYWPDNPLEAEAVKGVRRRQ